jgi:NAD(P)-dependent dehydrogenase (short-subunit alcohol dehydrogenase family)
VSNQTGLAGRRVAVVTGGGGGIGTAAAIQLARKGAVVVAMDPGVGVEGEPLDEPTAAETIERIEAEGGLGRASTASVTDREAVRDLFEEVVRDFGSLDVVVNTAGILRFPRFPDASEDDWLAVLDVHLGGYLNVLSAALPVMVESGYGRVVGFTSGAGLARTIADGPAYGSAKRAIAALTWELGPLLPDGVSVNALAPIAATKMVRAALTAGGVGPQGLDLTSMPQADDMAPAVALMASEEFGWCKGQVIFSAGSELTVIRPPRLLEAVRTEDVPDFRSALATLVPVILNPAEAQQNTAGGSNPRFGPIFDQPASPTSSTTGKDAQHADRPTCVLVSADAGIGAVLVKALEAWDMVVVGIGAWQPFDTAAGRVPTDFSEIADLLERAGRMTGRIDAVVIALDHGHEAASPDRASWQQVLEGHTDTVKHIAARAGWLRAGARHAGRSGRPLRVVQVTNATTPAGRTSAQAIAQMARCANDTPFSVPVDAYAISLETTHPANHKPLCDLIARLAWAEDTKDLRGAELVVHNNWIGLRSHPGPVASISFGGPSIPAWVNNTLQEALGTQPA